MAKCRYCGKQVHLGKWQHERYCPENPDHMTAVSERSRFKLESANGLKSMWYFWNHCFLGRNRAYQPRKLKLKEEVRSTGKLCHRCGRTGSLEYVNDALVFLFCWHEVPGKDEKRILDFLFHRYQMDMSGASIEKVDDSLKIITETHSVTLRLEQYWYESCLRNRMYLRIDNGEEETHYAQRVDGEINVYVKIVAVCRKCKSEIKAERLEGAREQIMIKNLLLADKFQDLLDECEKKGTCDILAAHHELLQNDDDRLRTSVLQDLICKNKYEDKWNEILDESKVILESKRLEIKKRIVAEKGNEVSGAESMSALRRDKNMVTEKCGRYEAYDFKSKRLITNLWGIGQKEIISLDKNCIFVNSDDSYGWRWDRPSPVPQNGQSNIAPIAPSVCVGTDPLGAFATTEYLPIRLRDIDSLILYANYIYSVMPASEDSQNLSYDIWITDSGDPKPSTPRQEVMVWLNWLNVPMPEDKRGEDVSDGYNTYKQYAWENYHAFILDVLPQPEQKTSTVDLKKIFEYLLNKGELKGDQWLALIALENEVWKGKGKMTINQMDSQLNGIWISCPAVMYSQ